MYCIWGLLSLLGLVRHKENPVVVADRSREYKWGKNSVENEETPCKKLEND